MSGTGKTPGVTPRGQRAAMGWAAMGRDGIGRMEDRRAANPEVLICGPNQQPKMYVHVICLDIHHFKMDLIQVHVAITSYNIL